MQFNNLIKNFAQYLINMKVTNFYTPNQGMSFYLHQYRNEEEAKEFSEEVKEEQEDHSTIVPEVHSWARYDWKF